MSYGEGSRTQSQLADFSLSPARSLTSAGKRTKWPPTDEKVKAVINKATQGCVVY